LVLYIVIGAGALIILIIIIICCLCCRKRKPKRDRLQTELVIALSGRSPRSTDQQYVDPETDAD